MTVAVFLIPIAALLVLAAAAPMLLSARRALATPAVYGAALLISAAAMGTALRYLVVESDALRLVLPIGIPWLGAHLRVDGLSAFFLVVVNLGAAAASLAALGYGLHEAAPGRVLPFYPLFLAGMNLVVLADDAFTFLLAWETMSLASWAIVMAHHKEEGNAHAGYVYIAMAAFGTVSLLLAFGLLAGPHGAYSFDEIRVREAGLLPVSLAFGLVILGAGSKAGLVPLHAWLPLAHPAAPSHASALLSGVMTKVAVYAFVRIVFDLLGEPEWWWSVVTLLLGGISAAMGVLYALMQHDLKRLLAYHTVENIGIIFIGLGLALAFNANGMAAAAALAMTAALFHVLNHSLFKNLLFLGAGAVLTATGTRDMEHQGGLIHRMPVTAFAFLAGSAAISALPPLNGFASEWLTFQAILVSPALPQWTLKFLVPAVGTLLALSAALAAACFVKAFGITFLGRPRSNVAARAVEVDAWQRAAMLLLVSLCVLAGVVPGAVIDALAVAVQPLTGARLAVQLDSQWLTVVPIADIRSSYNGALVFVMIAAAAMIAAYAIHRLASDKIRRVPPWDCGFPNADPRTQYTAGSFAQPIRRIFGSWVFKARESVFMPPPGGLEPARFQVSGRDPVWDFGYEPIARWVSFAADRMNFLQFLTIRRYLSLVFASLVLLLAVIAIWR